MAMIGKEYRRMASTGDHYSAARVRNTPSRQLGENCVCERNGFNPKAYDREKKRYLGALRGRAMP